MNPARTIGRDLVSGTWTDLWVNIVGPLIGATAALGGAYVLRGHGGGGVGSATAQGALFTNASRPDDF